VNLRRQQAPSDSSPVQGLGRVIELIAVCIAALTSIAVSIADMVGALERAPWLSDRIPQITLLLVAIFILYLTARPVDPERLSKAVIKHLRDELDALQGTSTLTFEQPEDLYYYVADKVRNAGHSVDDITWGSRSAFRTPAEKQAYDTYLNAMQEACRKPTMIYREVSSLSDSHYYKRAKQLIDQGGLSYNLGYYDTGKVRIPLVSYMVVDGREVIGWFYRDPVGHAQTREVYVSISQPILVRLFQDYFQSIWDGSIKVKEYDNIDNQLLTQIGARLAKQ